MKVYAQSDRKKNPTPINVRHMTRDEIMQTSHSHVRCLLNNGRLGQVKINGNIRTWKRDPNRVEIPVKYGMYEFAVLSLDEALQRFVMVIHDET